MSFTELWFSTAAEGKYHVEVAIQLQPYSTTDCFAWISLENFEQPLDFLSCCSESSLKVNVNVNVLSSAR